MKRILVIDTDIDNLTTVELILSAQGHKVHSHSKWRRGFFQIEVVKPSLIILEVFLDTADGRNLAKQIKHKQPIKHIPILLFSSDHTVKESLKECGANEFLGKPFKIDHLVETVKRMIAA